MSVVIKGGTVITAILEGFEVTDLPRYTLSRGDVVFGDGEIMGEEGRDRFVARPPFPAVSRALSSGKALTTRQPVERSAADMPIGV